MWTAMVDFLLKFSYLLQSLRSKPESAGSPGCHVQWCRVKHDVSCFQTPAAEMAGHFWH